jgi:hypothetical protein
LTKSDEWTDVCGLLTPRERLAALEQKVAAGSCGSYDDLLKEFQSMYDNYRSDEWQYIYDIFLKEYNIRLDAITKEQAVSAIEEWQKAATSLHSMILEDSKREFGPFAKIGYGIDQSEEAMERDFTAVRGSSETNSVVQKLVKEGNDIQQRYTQFKNKLTI